MPRQVPAPKPFPAPLPAPPPLPLPSDPRLMKEQLLLRERLEFEVYRPWFLPPRVRILMVTDGEGMFNTSHRFGLGHVIETLADHPWWWVRFEVTTVHRDDVPFGLTAADRALAAYPGRAASPGKAALPAKALSFNFKFSGDTRPALALANFDEIWLYGIAGSSPALTPAEITALRSFMDGGGGVLAMGDHSSLGADLCGEIPRVKHMRKWKFGGPAGDPPPAFGPGRIDTLRAGPTPGFQFPDQSDGVPQPIIPKRYYSSLDYHVFRRRWHPHPVLCGIDGVIDVLPDHMHEGECVVPAVLPPGDFPGGVAPEVIATGEVLPHTTDNSSEGPFGVDVTSTARTFGILGAYDGHLPAANVGRIVVDATWHHWVHVNLVGFVNGAPASPELAKIRNYYWNVALWLAPRRLQSAMFNTAVYGLPWLQPFDEVRLERGRDVYWLGIEAMDAIGRRAGQCVMREWLEIVFIEFQLPFETNLPDPPPYEEILQRFAAAVLGGMVQGAMALAAEGAREKVPEARVAKALEEGARAGFRHNLKRERERHEAREALLTRLERGGKGATKRR